MLFSNRQSNENESSIGICASGYALIADVQEFGSKCMMLDEVERGSWQHDHGNSTCDKPPPNRRAFSSTKSLLYPKSLQRCLRESPSRQLWIACPIQVLHPRPHVTLLCFESDGVPRPNYGHSVHHRRHDACEMLIYVNDASIDGSETLAMLQGPDWSFPHLVHTPG